MCGIAGILNFSDRPVDQDVLKAMTRALAHRGPDGEGMFVDGGLGLGHRRLAIIDTSPAAAQPMESLDGGYCLSYNGEIYNFQELRAELEGKGYKFSTRSDTEVVLNALVEWGESALMRFNGMFALAFWDRRKKRLLLARDRYGIKPLYFCLTGGSIIFASEIKSFLSHPEFRVGMDTAALAEYLTFQNFFGSRLLFENVSIMSAGSYVWLQNDSRSCNVINYWDFDFREDPALNSEAKCLEEFDYLFSQAVSRQLVSDVPVSAYLSGGIDTGSITSLAARQIPGIRTFTIGFDLNSASGMELNFDERARAEYMSYLFKTEHYEMVLKAGDMERIMPHLVWHIEEPRIGQSYPNYYAAFLASKFGKVVLSGAGGDELFGGYPWRYFGSGGQYDFEGYINRYFSYWQRLIPEGALSKLMAPCRSDVDDTSMRNLFCGVYKRHSDQLSRPEDLVNHSLYFEAKTFLHGLLVVEDKLSMANGLEIRVPFLDNDLVDFAMRVPVTYKLGGLGLPTHLNENEMAQKQQRHAEMSRNGKMLLRKAASRYIPDSVTNAVKQGFSGPDASWFKGESIDFVRETLMNGNADIYSFIDKKQARALVQEHLDGVTNRRLLIWSLLNLEYWCQIFLSGRMRPEVS